MSILSDEERARQHEVANALKMGMSPYEHISHLTQPPRGYIRKRRRSRAKPSCRSMQHSSSDRPLIPKPAMQGSVSAFRAYPSGSVKIGDTLFVDGSPYISCSICQMVVKLSDGQSVQAYTGLKTKMWDGSLRSMKQRIIKSYKVLKGFWLRRWESTVGADGVEDRTVKIIPIVRLVPACLTCWQRQEDQKALAYQVASRAGEEPRIVFYGMDTKPIDEDPTKRRGK